MSISIGDAVLKVGIDKKSFDAGMKSIGNQIAQHRKAIGVGMTAAGAAIVGGLAMAMKSASGFETAMREVNTMMGLSQEEFKAFSKEVQALASDLGVDAVEAAKALYQAISAGIPKENVLEFMEIATKAAIGGVTDTATAVDGLTTVINAFKLPLSDTQKVADIMFTTVKGGKTTFEELSASLFQVAPIAAASGVKFEEVSAALASMTKQGVPTKIATTQLRQAMVALQKPTVDMAKAIQDLGYESGQAMLEEIGFAGALNELRDATGGSNEMLMKMFGSVEAGGAVLALTGENALTFAADIEAMGASAGAATDAFEEMEKSTSRHMDKLKASFKDISITVGNVLLPILRDIVERIKPIINAIKDWIAEHPGLTKVIVIVTAAIGGLLLVLGPLLILLPGITAALPLLGAAFHAALGPIGLITAAIAAVIAIGVLLWQNWEKIKEKVVVIWGNIANFFKAVWGKIVGFFKEHWDKIIAILFPPVGIPLLIARNWEKVVDFFKNMWERIKGFFADAINWIIDRINWLIDKINMISPIKISEIGHIGEEPPPAFYRGMAGMPGLQHGGIIKEPTLLSSLSTLRPYAVAGEAGPEVVSPMGGYRTANITIQLDSRTLARAIGQPLVDEIMIRQGIR